MANERTVSLPLDTEQLAPWGAVVAGLLIMLGSVLPWATAHTFFGSLSVAGTDGDGKITLGLGLVIAALGVIYLTGNISRKVAMWGVAIIGAAAGLAAGYDLLQGGPVIGVPLPHARTFINAAHLNFNPFGSVSVGIGLYIAYFGGSLAYLAGILLSQPSTLTEPISPTTTLLDEVQPPPTV